MHRIARLKNPIQDYAWGSRTAIPSLLGLPVPSERPVAELWLGAHPKAPSEVMADGAWQSLDRVIASDPVSVLGTRVAERYANRLPFLFKVLAADRPLSIQVHPNREQAQKGFERENRLGIPLDAAERNYRDSNHKPELLSAVTPFEALKGFRPFDDLLSLLGKVSSETLSHELDGLRKAPDSPGLRQFFTSLISMNQSLRERVIESAAERARRFMDHDRPFWWVVELSRLYPGDVGVLSPLIFNLVTLAPGEAIYIPAGEPHAYLKGMGVELMANSDNVLRGGLTPKHVDVPELLRILNFTQGPVQKLVSKPCVPGESFYETPAEEFQLSVITVSDGVRFTSETDRSVEIMICMEGEARIADLGSGASEMLKKGVSVLIPAAIDSYQIEGEGTLYMAAVGGRF
ncbi:MAG: mannose-6-phosphate isomerase, class I [Deltaproteobacteria bacterium]|nr:mannose-6-phosphate isomerase, class I [Deltaproteobacteria bacterium]